MKTADQWAEVLRLWKESGREGSPWRSGLRTRAKWYLLEAPTDVGTFVWYDNYGDLVEDPSPGDAWLEERSFRPDLTDPATLGCLLGLVREVWGDPNVFLAPMFTLGAWRCCCPDAPLDAPTEGEALLAALIAGLRREVTP